MVVAVLMSENVNLNCCDFVITDIVIVIVIVVDMI